MLVGLGYGFLTWVTRALLSFRPSNSIGSRLGRCQSGLVVDLNIGLAYIDDCIGRANVASSSECIMILDKRSTTQIQIDYHGCLFSH